jgi:hypothetical protein
MAMTKDDFYSSLRSRNRFMRTLLRRRLAASGRN